MMGVRAIPAGLLERRESAAALEETTFLKIIVPATLPTCSPGTGSACIAWLVIVASEMLTGTPASAVPLEEYNKLIYAHILLAILTNRLIGFVLDRLMGLCRGHAEDGPDALPYIEPLG